VPFCRDCGTRVDEEDRYCRSCGHAQGAVAARRGTTRIVAQGWSTTSLTEWIIDGLVGWIVGSFIRVSSCDGWRMAVSLRDVGDGKRSLEPSEDDDGFWRPSTRGARLRRSAGRSGSTDQRRTSGHDLVTQKLVRNG
jgi:hypothetical protein